MRQVLMKYIKMVFLTSFFYGIILIYLILEGVFMKSILVTGAAGTVGLQVLRFTHTKIV